VSPARRPQAAIFTGFGFAFLELILAFISPIQYFYYAQLPFGWTTIIVLIAGFNGIQLIFMGIIGESIVEERIDFTRDRAEQARAR
jgi:hypothetical protein